MRRLRFEYVQHMINDQERVLYVQMKRKIITSVAANNQSTIIKRDKIFICFVAIDGCYMNTRLLAFKKR